MRFVSAFASVNSFPLDWEATRQRPPFILGGVNLVPIRPSRKRGFPALPQATGLQKSALDAPGTEEEDRKAAVAEARRRYAEGADGRLLILA